MSTWTQDDIRKAKSVLKQYPIDRYRDALLEIGVQIDRDITPGAIRAAFMRNRLKAPTEYCRKKGEPVENVVRTHVPSAKVSKGRIHFVIGDTQIKPGVPTAHLSWIGRYLVDQFAGQDVTVIHLGDHWDMESLSSYDKGKKASEGRRYKEDIKAGNDGFSLLCQPLADFNKGRKPENQWWPDRHFLIGNHEERIARAVNDEAQLEGALSYDDFNAKEWGWKVHDFLEPFWRDGVAYSHYFYNPNTGRPYSGENLALRLKTIGHSFTMGHQQGLNIATRAVGKGRHCGLVCGTSYLHDEKYLGPQGNSYWRGIAVKHQVEDGAYDPMLVSLDYLCRRYENKTLEDYMLQWRFSNA